MTKAYFGSNGKGKFVIETPDWLKLEIIERFGEYFDPCPVNPQFDGLSIDWPRDKAVYVNPPYTRGQLSKWVKKCHFEAVSGSLVVLLIPSYTDTAYFHDYIYKKQGVEIEFFRGRIQFKGYTKSTASFASMLVIFNRGCEK